MMFKILIAIKITYLVYDEIANGIKVRSRCDWFEQGEKSSKFFLNLEKHRATKSQIRYIVHKNKEIISPSEINKSLYDFYQTIFTQKKENMDSSANSDSK